MNPFLKKIDRALEKVFNAMLWVSSGILVFVIVSVVVEVSMRGLMNRPQAWVIEFSEYALLYMTFLAAPYLLKKERNITVDILTLRISPRTRRVLSILHYIVSGLVSFGFVYFGVRATIDHYVRNIYNPTVLQIPMAYLLMVIPVGGICLFVQSLIGLHGSCLKFILRGE